jgi:hypothetical protein
MLDDVTGLEIVSLFYKLSFTAHKSKKANGNTRRSVAVVFGVTVFYFTA